MNRIPERMEKRKPENYNDFIEPRRKLKAQRMHDYYRSLNAPTHRSLVN
jgi:hypothetical protein